MFAFPKTNDRRHLVHKLTTHQKHAWLEFGTGERIPLSCGFLCDRNDVTIEHFDAIVSAAVSSHTVTRASQEYRRFMQQTRTIQYKVNNNNNKEEEGETIIINSTDNLISALEHYFAQQDSGKTESTRGSSVDDGLVFEVKYVVATMDDSIHKKHEPVDNLLNRNEDSPVGSKQQKLKGRLTYVPLRYSSLTGNMVEAMPGMDKFQKMIDDEVAKGDPPLAALSNSIVSAIFLNRMGSISMGLMLFAGVYGVWTKKIKVNRSN